MPPTARLTTAAILALLGCGCTSLDAVPVKPVGEARLTFADGRTAGVAALLSDARGLRLTIRASGLTPGAHGFHLHTAGKCEAPGFTSAGGHLNPDARKHGTLSGAGPHLGDLPNLVAAANGAGAATETVPGGPSALAAIFDGDGTALVIHANADDYRTDPAGNAGERVACGVLRRVG